MSEATLSKQDWVVKMLKDNENEAYAWKAKLNLPGKKWINRTAMLAMQDLRIERERLVDAYKDVTGEDWKETIAEVITTGRGKEDQGGDDGPEKREPVLV